MFRKLVVPQLRNYRQMASAPVKTDLIRTENVNGCGILTLNRPKALNAVNYEMVARIHEVLNEWQSTKSMILIKGEGEKAFCAGGDVRTLVESNDPSVSRNFFRTEYTTNYIIGTMKIPYIAVIDGITMGGGAGLSLHGKYRIATEKTMFAMPETLIGFFPDVGGSYFLTRLVRKQLAMYLALTGDQLRGSDVHESGLATHYCKRDKLPELIKKITNLKNANDLPQLLNEYHPLADDITKDFSQYRKQIDECFGASTVEEVVANLEKDKSEWAQKTLAKIHLVSPTSLKVAVRLLQLGEKSSLAECLQREFRVAYHMVENNDFHEGVRSRLITKDNSPKWSPARIEDVTDEYVESFFRPLPAQEELILNGNVLNSKL